jgi:DSF synthase
MGANNLLNVGAKWILNNSGVTADNCNNELTNMQNHVQLASMAEYKLIRLRVCGQPLPCLTDSVLDEVIEQQEYIRQYAKKDEVRFVTLESMHQQVWNLGGDLALLIECIENQDRKHLRDYAYKGINCLLNNIYAPYTTIAIVDGITYGSGFEAALSCNYIIAEQQAKFSFPETMYGLFPGMGAFSLLSRKIGEVRAREMITSHRVWSAQELFDMMLIHKVVPKGEGFQSAIKLIQEKSRYPELSNVIDCLHARLGTQITQDELAGIMDQWVELVMGLQQANLKILKRLARAQKIKYAT